MNSRRLLIGAIVAAVSIATVALVWLIRRGDASDQVVRVSVRHAGVPEKSEQEIALGMEKALAKVPRLVSQRIEITRLGVTAECSFAPKSRRELTENRDAVASAYTDRLASVSDVPPETPAIWVFSSKDLTKELRGVGNVIVETCGEPQPNRVRVAIDTEKLRARLGGDIVEFELAVGADTLRRLTTWEAVDPEEVGNRVIRDDIRVKDVATVTQEPRPNRCNAYLHDGKTAISQMISPLPGFNSDARAKLDAIAREAQATIVHEPDAVEARFTTDPTGSAESRRRVAADYALRGKVARGLDVVGSRVFFDGSGSVVVRKPAKVEALRDLIKETHGVAWGGIRGTPRLEVTIKGDDRKALEKRAKEVQARIATIEGVGEPLTLATGAITSFVYDVDAEAAEAQGISVPALQLIARSLQGDLVEDAAVLIEPRPLEKLFVRGAPLSAYVHMRQRPVTVRLFRADQKPAIELAFEIDDRAVRDHVRQALGESEAPDVSLRVLPAF